jgi:hypothetical protein
MLGERSFHAQDCFGDGVVGIDFGLKEDLTKFLNFITLIRNGKAKD